VREVGAVGVVLADTAMQTDEVRPAVMMRNRIMAFAAIGAELLYAAPTHSVCMISGHRQPWIGLGG
jgi:hypothetical protein